MAANSIVPNVCILGRTGAFETDELDGQKVRIIKINHHLSHSHLISFCRYIYTTSFGVMSLYIAKIVVESKVESIVE